MIMGVGDGDGVRGVGVGVPVGVGEGVGVGFGLGDGVCVILQPPYLSAKKSQVGGEGGDGVAGIFVINAGFLQKCKSILLFAALSQAMLSWLNLNMSAPVQEG
jgi:hypothetical protein